MKRANTVPTIYRGPVAEMRGVAVHDAVGTPILRGVDLSVHRGERLLITGRSGSGKSTALRTLGGIVTASTGEVRLFGGSFSQMSKGERAEVVRGRVGTVYQRHMLHEGRTVRQNIESSHDTTRRGPVVEDHVAWLAVSLGIHDKLSRTADTLSGGEKQRVAIARALLPRPELILLDEPTAALDSGGEYGKLGAYATIAAWATATAATIVMVSHDREAQHIATRTVVMDDGLIVPSAPTPSETMRGAA